MRGSASPSLHVFPIARVGAADFLRLVQLVELGELLVLERLDAAAGFGVFRAALARFVAIGAEHPGVAVGNLVAVLVEEIDVIDLLKGAAGKAGLVLDQILQVRLGGDGVAAQHGLVPRPVRARPHGMNARKTAAVAGHDAAGGEQKARQRHDGAVARFLGIGRIGPQRVVVADAVRVVANAVARRLVIPRLDRIGDRHADALAKVVETLFGDLGEAVGGGFGDGLHSSSPEKFSVRSRPRLRARVGSCGELCPRASWEARSRRRCDAEIRAGSAARA